MVECERIDGMRYKIFKLTVLLAIGAAATATMITCSDDEEPFTDSSEVTDPYCTETADWFEELSVSAAYSEEAPEYVTVTFEPSKDIVDMNGRVEVTGAKIDNIIFDGHTLWIVLLTSADTNEITIEGAVDCTTETQPLVLTLFLSPEDKSVTFELSYTEDNGSDAGDDNDAGI